MRCLFLPFLLAVSLPSTVSAQTPPPSTAEWRSQIPQMMEWTREGEWEELLTTARDLLKEATGQPDLLMFEAGALHGLQRYSEAQKRTAEFLEGHPDSHHRDQALFLRGDSLLKMGRRNAAAGLLHEASRTTEDPTLRRKIDTLLSPPKVQVTVGIRLGGEPPEGPEEVEAAKQVAVRLLARAVRAYKEKTGDNPQRLEDLVTGDPPILKALPEDPTNPGNPVDLEEALAFLAGTSAGP